MFLFAFYWNYRDTQTGHHAVVRGYLQDFAHAYTVDKGYVIDGTQHPNPWMGVVDIKTMNVIEQSRLNINTAIEACNSISTY